jgi:hypothetical protein
MILSPLVRKIESDDACTTEKESGTFACSRSASATKRPSERQVWKPATRVACGHCRAISRMFLEAECELPDYVSWGRKTKVGCIFLRSRVNIVRTISRTLASCEIDLRFMEGYLPAAFFSISTFQEVAVSGQSTLARLSVQPNGRADNFRVARHAGRIAHTQTAGCADPTVVEHSEKESEISPPAQHPAVYGCSMRSGWCTGPSTERGAVRPRKGRRLNAISSSSRGR